MFFAEVAGLPKKKVSEGRKVAGTVEDLITRAQAADLRGVSVAAISELVRRGRLSETKIAGRSLLSRIEGLAFEALPAGRPPKSDG